MKVILIEDIDQLGRAGDTKEVKNGFARNYLFPRKLAIEATAGNLKFWEQQKQVLKSKQDKARGEAEGLAASLSGFNFTIPVKAGEDDRLFGSVTSQNISDTLSKNGFEISRKNIELEAPIKTLGTHEVRVKLHSDVAVSVKVEVVKED